MPARLWKALADAGVLGLAIAEEYGGSGGSLSDLGVFCVEAGRALCPTIVHSTMHAALAIDRLGGSAHACAWLPALASGAARGTTALWSPRDAAVVTPVLEAGPTARAGGSTARRLRRRRRPRRPDRGLGERRRTHAGLRCRAGSRGVSRRAAGDDGWAPRVHGALRRRGRRRTPPTVSDTTLRRVANTAVALLSPRPRRGGRGGAAAHRRLHEDAPPVRPADRVVPGGPAPGRQHAHRACPRPDWPRTRRCSGSAWAAPATRETAIARMPRRRGQADHPRRPPIARRHGLRRRHRPASVLGARARALDARWRSRHRRDVA